MGNYRKIKNIIENNKTTSTLLIVALVDYEKKNKIDGEKIANNIKDAVKILIKNQQLKPKIAIIQVGDNFASTKYVNKKIKVSAEIGIEMQLYHFDKNITEVKLIDKIKALNNDKIIHGVMCQLPLPDKINTFNILNTIAPEKDIDGLNPFNAGLLHYSKSVPYQVEDVLSNNNNSNNFSKNIKQLGKTLPFIPCTPLGCLYLITETLKEEDKNIIGKNAVVIGNSNLVGKSIARLLTQSGATTTTIHSKSKNFDYIIKNADVIVSATGVAIELKKVKKGAILIDVGIRKKEDGTGICGDLDYQKYIKNNKITPVPKGVGPMTIACLMLNSYLACLKNS